MGGIEDAVMGDLWPQAQPGAAGADYGSVTLSPEGRFEVRSCPCLTLTYTVGKYGLDDTGAIKIVSRWTDDGGRAQITDPQAARYVTAQASNGVHLEIEIESYPHQRPWYNGIRLTVKKGFMEPGDTITIVLGDQSGGGPGWQLQSFCEAHHEFRVLVDACATGVFIPIASPGMAVVAGPPVGWVLNAPSLRAPGDEFALGLRAEDHWGNATDQVAGALHLRADGPVTALPERVVWTEGARGMRIKGLRVETPGITRFELLDGSGTLLARSNPMVIREGDFRGFWGDLHGQSGETVGIDPIADYMRFARDVAHLDVTSHQANDFQVTNAFWKKINEVTAAMNDEGRFVVFPGYEWSANTPLGGDHNVFFRHEDRPIRRSSHALLADRSDIGDDVTTLEDLFAGLRGEDCVLYAHIGGRPADISRAENARLRTAVEVHSDWGTFEWIMTDAFDQGFRVGLVCNSDGHKGAPGACYPGASEFGAYSGLTCFLSPKLTRDGIFDAMRRRHHYGTTGCRMDMELRVDLGEGGLRWPVDPRVDPDAAPETARHVMMGDIARAPGGKVTLSLQVAAQSPVVQIDVLRGAQVIHELRPHASDPGSRRLRITMAGAEYRGRGRQTHWQGAITVEGAEIARMERFNIWNHDRRFSQTSERRVDFDAVTTGNFCGCDLWLTNSDAQVRFDNSIAGGLLDLGLQDSITLDAGGLARQITMERLPEALDQQEVVLEMDVATLSEGDTPLWVRVTTEDGHRAWSSPVYLIPGRSLHT